MSNLLSLRGCMKEGQLVRWALQEARFGKEIRASLLRVARYVSLRCKNNVRDHNCIRLHGPKKMTGRMLPSGIALCLTGLNCTISRCISVKSLSFMSPCAHVPYFKSAGNINGKDVLEFVLFSVAILKNFTRLNFP